jgi:hypothetical protein
MAARRAPACLLAATPSPQRTSSKVASSSQVGAPCIERPPQGLVPAPRRGWTADGVRPVTSGEERPPPSLLDGLGEQLAAEDPLPPVGLWRRWRRRRHLDPLLL